MNYIIKRTTKPAFLGEEFIATGRWTPETSKAYNSLRAERLRLHEYDGWECATDLNFLNDLWRLKSFRIFSSVAVNLSPLLLRPELTHLGLLGIRLAKSSSNFDFAKLPSLEVLDARWCPGLQNLEMARNLNYLQVWDYSGSGEWSVCTLKMLEVLEVHGARKIESVDLSGLTRLRSITLLAMPRLKVLRGADTLKVGGDFWLRIDGAKGLDTSILPVFSRAMHVSFQGKQIVNQGVNVRPWP